MYSASGGGVGKNSLSSSLPVIARTNSLPAIFSSPQVRHALFPPFWRRFFPPLYSRQIFSTFPASRHFRTQFNMQLTSRIETETMASAHQYEPSHRHESEWIYSSILSKRVFTPLNDYIHQQLTLASSATSSSSSSSLASSCSSPWRWCYALLELYIAMCGYAFNPVMFPIWPILIYTLSLGRCSSLSNASTSLLKLNAPSNNDNIFDWKKWNSFQQLLLHHDHRHHAATTNTVLYLISVFLTLAFTELGKAFFSTSRPQPSLEEKGVWSIPRKYEKLVASLKSKHSFPSGDCAQAMNFCMMVCKYVMTTASGTTTSALSSSDSRIHEMTNWNDNNTITHHLINMFLFGIFLPSVAFARIYFRCHWIEDCIGGVALSWALHTTIIPEIAKHI